MKNQQRRRLVQAVCLGAAMAALPAAAKPVSNDPVYCLKHFIETMPAAQGRFTQEVRDRQNKLTGPVTEGFFRYRRPGCFQWNYEKPYEMQMLSDGETFWIYDPGLFQVTRKRVKDELPQTPAAILFGDTQWEKYWTLSAVDAHTVKAVPLDKDSGFSDIRITFDEQGRLKALRFLDSFAQTTQITFTGVKADQAPRQAFVFHPPEGVDVLDM